MRPPRTDRRGNKYDRQRRKRWLLREYGDGHRCWCVHCNRKLTLRTITVDRVVPGGSYSYSNIEPSCGPCNFGRGNRPLAPRVAE